MLLVNTSTATKGGAVQVCTWFIVECIHHKVDAFFILSEAVFKELKLLKIDLSDSRIFISDVSPSRSRRQRALIRELERRLAPKTVFTVFGPAYVRFRAYHVMGFANGWISHSTFDSLFRTYRYNALSYLKFLFSFVYRFRWLRLADLWVFETKVARNGFVKRLRVPKSATRVIGNTCAPRFIYERNVEPKSSKFRILYFTADYPHKALSKISHYAKALYLKRKCFDFVFTITIDQSSGTAKRIRKQARKLGVEDAIEITGQVPISKAVSLVDSASLVLQMSYLETFSANYPEAMARRRPMLLSDFEFSREICEKAALYVDPDDSSAVAEKIHSLMSDPTQRDILIEEGLRVLEKMPSPGDRFMSYLDLLI